MASTRPSWRPRISSKTLKTTASSSAVRCASVATRHCPSASSPSNRPSTVCVFPMSTAINTLHALPELPDTRQVGGLQQARHRAAARNIQVGVEVRGANEVEGAANPPVRQPEIRPLHDLIPENQHVDVAGARRLLPLALSPEPRLHALAVAQQFDRRQPAPNLDHAVQVVRLVDRKSTR